VEKMFIPQYEILSSGIFLPRLKKKNMKSIQNNQAKICIGILCRNVTNQTTKCGPCYIDLDDNQSAVCSSCCITDCRAPVIIGLLDLKGNLEDAMDRKFNNPVKNCSFYSSPQPFC